MRPTSSVSSAYFSRHAGAGPASLGAARSRFPIGSGACRSGSESLQSFIEGGEARALRGAGAAWLRRGCSTAGWGRQDIFTVPGLSFLTEVAAVAPRSA